MVKSQTSETHIKIVVIVFVVGYDTTNIEKRLVTSTTKPSGDIYYLPRFYYIMKVVTAVV